MYPLHGTWMRIIIIIIKKTKTKLGISMKKNSLLAKTVSSERQSYRPEVNDSIHTKKIKKRPLPSFLVISSSLTHVIRFLFCHITRGAKMPPL